MCSLIFTLLGKVASDGLYDENCPTCTGQINNLGYKDTKINFYRDGYKFYTNYKHPLNGKCPVLELNIKNSQFVKCSSFGTNVPTSTGGAIFTDKVPTVSIIDSFFFNNGCNLGGAFAVLECSKLQITSSSFEYNQATHYGGAGFISYSNVDISECHFAKNSANVFAALFISEIAGRSTRPSKIYHTEFIENSANSGSALGVTYADFLNISRVLFQGNTIKGSYAAKYQTNGKNLKGALYLLGSKLSRFELEYLTFQDNTGFFDGFDIQLDSATQTSQTEEIIPDYEVILDSTNILQADIPDNWDHSVPIATSKFVKFVNLSYKVRLDPAVQVTAFPNYKTPTFMNEWQTPTAALVNVRAPANGMKLLEDEPLESVRNYPANANSIFTSIDANDENIHIAGGANAPTIDNVPISGKRYNSNLDNEFDTYRKQGFCTFTITNTLFKDIISTQYTDGGVISLSFSTLNLDSSLFEGFGFSTTSENPTRGGAIYLFLSNATMVNTVFQNPLAQPLVSEGYAIYLERTSFYFENSTFNSSTDSNLGFALTAVAPYPYHDDLKSTLSYCRFVKGSTSSGIFIRGNDHQYGYANIISSCFDSHPFATTFDTYEFLTSETNPDILLEDASIVVHSSVFEDKVVYGGTNKHSNAIVYNKNSNTFGEGNYTYTENNFCALRCFSFITGLYEPSPDPTFSIDTPTPFQQQVQAKNDNAIINSYQDVVKTSQKNFPWLYITVAVVVAVIALIVLGIYIKRRKDDGEYDDYEEEEEESEMIAATTITIGSVSELPVVSLNNPLCTVQQQSSDDSLFDDVDDLDFA
jgi:hypothetical protein